MMGKLLDNVYMYCMHAFIDVCKKLAYTIYAYMNVCIDVCVYAYRFVYRYPDIYMYVCRQSLHICVYVPIYISM